ncbi:hypothetical protein RV18_GL002722 [Enterococcus termitis]|nr:hypothetical protein RV18_GL002722 [Enterococcus termitis]
MLGFFKVLLTYSGIGHCANAFFVSILGLIFIDGGDNET